MIRYSHEDRALFIDDRELGPVRPPDGPVTPEDDREVAERGAELARALNREIAKHGISPIRLLALQGMTFWLDRPRAEAMVVLVTTPSPTRSASYSANAASTSPAQWRIFQPPG